MSAPGRQLGHLKETHNLLKAARIPHWLAGGWAIDFLVGRVTRQHSDVDFAIWKDDWRRVEALLRAHEFTLRANEFPDETGRLAHQGTHFEFYLLQKNAAGDIFVGGRWKDWPFSDDCWNATGCLQGAGNNVGLTKSTVHHCGRKTSKTLIFFVRIWRGRCRSKACSVSPTR